MLFRKIILNAIVIGFVTGLLLTLCQQFQVVPIIFAAEEYEIVEELTTVTSLHTGHHSEGHNHHDGNAWTPGDGAERLLYSTVSNVSTGIGFAAILLAFMCLAQLQTRSDITLFRGILWGIAGFITFFVSPGIGLPPEIPGIQVAELEQRQLWWGLAVFGTAIGFAIFAFAKSYYKLVGLVFIGSPHLIGAPSILGPEFAHPDANVVSILSDLHQQFIIASGVTNFIFWLSLGIISAWAINRWILVNLAGHS